MIKNFVPAFRSYRNYAPSQWVEILSYGGIFNFMHMRFTTYFTNDNSKENSQGKTR